MSSWHSFFYFLGVVFINGKAGGFDTAKNVHLEEGEERW
ncbi:hypothetical protein HMPREF1077_01637 [Parabacteroides johnsonii CL02T12C29]|uniref:Uncharacterized protein n=1 Tax=Parabacteroides johnsonii CL02T12C29 TaxID=999419 RepID=K5ZG49_9BACT|nr:hypothetical protein HMPREF1077_01637 [Parabacteroides johnsonii CL02T12C29]